MEFAFHSHIFASMHILMCLAGTCLAGPSGSACSLRNSKFPSGVGLKDRDVTVVFATSMAARLSDERELSRDDRERTKGQRLRIGLVTVLGKVPDRNLKGLSSVVFRPKRPRGGSRRSDKTKMD